MRIAKNDLAVLEMCAPYVAGSIFNARLTSEKEQLEELAAHDALTSLANRFLGRASELAKLSALLASSRIEYLADRRARRAIDNCEHMIGACAALVETLAANDTRLTVLTTNPPHLRAWLASRNRRVRAQFAGVHTLRHRARVWPTSAN